MADAVEQSLQLVVTEELVAHLSQAGGIGGISNSIPSIATLYRFRLLLDLCAMVFSRKNIFSRSSSWACHIRSDSSPQFSKDYFVTEIDHVDVASITDSMVMADMRHHVCRRILPLQLVGGRAASAAHKALRLMMSIGADAEDVDCALARCYSLAFDMGTERTLFTAPALKAKPPDESLVPTVGDRAGSQALDMIQLVAPEPDLDQEDVARLCPRALPIGDYDHEPQTNLAIVGEHFVSLSLTFTLSFD